MSHTVLRARRRCETGFGDGGDVFRFPFQVIESVLPLSQNVLAVLDDNNYPFSAGRVPGQADPNEFILIRLQGPIVQHAK